MAPGNRLRRQPGAQGAENPGFARSQAVLARKTVNRERFAQPGLAKALALAMIVIVTIVMTLYTLLQRRTSRWLR